MGSGEEKTVSQRVVELLRAEGIDTIFGIPDPSYAEIQQHALAAGMRTVAPRHEGAGGFMADAMARLTGKPQVILGAPGPGVANMLPALVVASMEHVPVIFIGPQRERIYDASVRRSKFQYTPQLRYFEPGVKYAAVVEFASQLDEIFHEAFRKAMSGTPGPVYIELPHSTVREKAVYPPIEPPERYRLVAEEAPQARVEQAADALAQAQRPVLIAGTGVHTARGHRELEALASALGCPVIPSYGGRGSLPETHPQVLPFASPPGIEATHGADVVLAVGTSLGEQLSYGRAERYYGDADAKRWILIERDATAIGVNRAVDVPLVGDLRAVLPQLTAALEKRGSIAASADLPRWREAFLAARRDGIAAAPEGAPVHPAKLMGAIRDATPDEAVVVRDGGCTSLWEIGLFELRSHDYLWTSKIGHLGTGLPYAVGAQLAVGRERPVLLITGDSAFGFHTMELETAVRHQLPIVTVINYDGGWGMEREIYKPFGGFDELHHAPVRFDEIARAMGAHGEYCERSDEVAPAIERAFASGKPAVVQVVTDMKVNDEEAPNWEAFLAWYGEEGVY